MAWFNHSIKRKIIYLTTLCLLCGFANLRALALANKVSLENQIEGVDQKVQKNLYSSLQSKQEHLGELTEPKIRDFFQQAPEQLKNTLQTLGFFKAKVTAQLNQQKNKWIASYTVTPGPILKITDLNLKITGPGLSNNELMTALKNFPLKKGDPLETSKYNEAKQFLFDQANNFGFITAAFEKKQIKINLPRNTAEIILVFYTGNRYFFGPIQFSPSPFKKKFLHRFLNFKPSEVYSQKKINQLAEILTNTNYFDQVNIIPLTPQLLPTSQPTLKNNRNQVPIKIEVIPRKSKQYNFGLGYGTDTGARGLVGIEMRNLRGNGESFKGLLKVSEAQNNLEAHYLLPGKNPALDQFDFSIAGQVQRLDYGKSETLQVSGGHVTSIKGWLQTVKLILQHEKAEYKNQAELDANKLSTNNTNLIIPSVTWSHISTDQLLQPTRGHNINFNILGSNKYLLAKEDFLQTQLSAKYLVPLTKNNEMILRANLGYIFVGDLTAIPLSMQFFTGGAQSVRGYGYNDIGPGRTLAVGSIELRHQIVSDWYAGIFYDAGQASDSFFREIKQGAGVSFTWKSIIGSISLSLAKALSLDDKPWKIQFSMGPEF